MNSLRKAVGFILAFFLITATAHAGKPKYIFYFICDGMGFAHRQLAELFLKEKEKDPTRKLVMNSLDVTGVITTHSADSLITDSAAAATALASGVKTNNGVIGKDPAGKDVTTLIDAAEAIGMATGIITTTRLTHATPASFVAHNISRHNEAEIALDFLDSEVEFLAGGGIRHFIPPNSHSGLKDVRGNELYSKRKDNVNLVVEFEEKGYRTFIGMEGSTEFTKTDFSKIEKAIALFDNSHLPYEIERRSKYKHVPSLAAMTKSAIEVLQQDPDGFFMLIEGGRIDHAAHANDPVSVIYDTLALDAAVRASQAFYQNHKDETLIVVVADHETGGLGLGRDAYGYKLNLSALLNTRVSVDDTLNGTHKYRGDRQAYFQFLAAEFGLSSPSGKEKTDLLASMSRADKGMKTGYSGYMNPVALAAAHILSARVNVTWTTTTHTGTLIPLSATGLGTKNITDRIDNTQVASIMATVLGFEF